MVKTLVNKGIQTKPKGNEKVNIKNCKQSINQAIKGIEPN